MEQNKDKNTSEEQLKKLKEKPLPEHIRKAVNDKIKHTTKPLAK